jgi:cell filamentation protein
VSDPYVYPGTTVLKNTFGERDQDRLDQIEADVVWPRFETLYIAGIDEHKALSADMHRAIHFHLFERLYPFAGQFRTVTMAKEGEIVYPPAEFLAANAEKVWRDINKRFSLKPASLDDLLEPLAESMGDLHVLHPFREGNTRTMQLAIREIAWRAGFSLEWMRADPSKLRAAGTAAAFGDNRPYIDMLRSIAIPVTERRQPPIDIRAPKERR